MASAAALRACWAAAAAGSIELDGRAPPLSAWSGGSGQGARGLDEAFTWGFIAEAEAERFGGAAHRLVNPLSAELAVMRPSLLPGLLAAARRNMARGERSVRLFELGRRYLAEGERPTAGLLLAGDAEPRHWKTGKARPADAFDAKAAALAALAAAGAPVERLATRQPGPAWYHPGRSAELVLGKSVLAAFGELHPALAGDVGAVAAAELFLDAVPEPKRRRKGAPDLPAFQPVRRDFAFLVPETLPAEALLRAVAGADRALVAEVELFDRFTGPGVPEGQVSLAIGVTLQPRERTLAEADLVALAEAVEAAAAKLGAVLRG
ncbi:MAG: hypothetical protein ACK4MT_09755 [Thermaurantiacus tibetensis]